MIHDPVECTQVQNIERLTDALLSGEGLIVRLTKISEKLSEIEKSVGSIKDDTAKIRYTLYGNGDPGLCENMRYCIKWINRINVIGATFITGAIATFYWIIQQLLKPIVSR